MGLPLIDGILASKWQHHKAALAEVGITAVVSFVPLIASAIFLLLDSQEGISVFSSFREVVSKGELVVYASSIIAPVFYLCLKDPPVVEKIPQFVLAFVIFFLCVVMYTLNYSGNVNNFALLVTWSYWLVASAIIVWYLSTLFREMTAVPDFKGPEMEFSDAFGSHIRGNRK